MSVTEKLQHVDQRQLVLLLNQWQAEIQGWIYAADIAAIGHENAVAMRNQVRADTLCSCLAELKEIIHHNSQAQEGKSLS